MVAVECDVTDRSRLREFIAVARAQNGPIDVLINNAGVIRVGPVEEMRDADYELSLRTHFWAALHAVNEVVPEMKAPARGESSISLRLAGRSLSRTCSRTRSGNSRSSATPTACGMSWPAMASWSRPSIPVS